GNGVILERFSDCLVGSLTMSAEAGQPLSLSAGIQGVNYKRILSSDTPAYTNITNLVTTPLESAAPISFNNADVMLWNPDAGPAALASTKKVRSFELTVENNLT